MDKFFYQAKGGKWQVAIIIEIKIQKESKNILFRLHNIHFSDCCIQKEAFAHAAIQWVEDTFGITMPKVVVSFDNTLGYHGMYCFDFSQFL
ncbi:MAG: hypothetical protein K2M46_09745 [Lachnospiraceae bacterium]|nr:hypothetical protein [Lachnospiraceae bacterium]